MSKPKDPAWFAAADAYYGLPGNVVGGKCHVVLDWRASHDGAWMAATYWQSQYISCAIRLEADGKHQVTLWWNNEILDIATAGETFESASALARELVERRAAEYLCAATQSPAAPRPASHR